MLCVWFLVIFISTGLSFERIVHNLSPLLPLLGHLNEQLKSSTGKIFVKGSLKFLLLKMILKYEGKQTESQKRFIQWHFQIWMVVLQDLQFQELQTQHDSRFVS